MTINGRVLSINDEVELRKELDLTISRENIDDDDDDPNKADNVLAAHGY